MNSRCRTDHLCGCGAECDYVTSAVDQTTLKGARRPCPSCLLLTIFADHIIFHQESGTMARIGHSTRTRALALLSALTLGALTLTHAVASPSPQTHNGQVPMGPSYLSPTSSIPSGAQPVDLTFDPVSSSTSGFGGPLRIELPFDPISSSSHSSKSGYSVEQQIAAQRGEFVHLSHKDFPQVSVRIKRVNEGNGVNALNEESDEEAFCDPTVTSWSGCECDVAEASSPKLAFPSVSGAAFILVLCSR